MSVAKNEKSFLLVLFFIMEHIMEHENNLSEVY